MYVHRIKPEHFDWCWHFLIFCLNVATCRSVILFSFIPLPAKSMCVENLKSEAKKLPRRSFRNAFQVFMTKPENRSFKNENMKFQNWGQKIET